MLFSTGIKETEQVESFEKYRLIEVNPQVRANEFYQDTEQTTMVNNSGNFDDRKNINDKYIQGMIGKIMNVQNVK